MVAGSVGGTAAAGTDRDSPFQVVDQLQDLGRGHRPGGIPGVAKGGDNAPAHGGAHQAVGAQAAEAAPQEMVAQGQERHLEIAGKDVEAPAPQAAMLGGDGMDKGHAGSSMIPHHADPSDTPSSDTARRAT